MSRFRTFFAAAFACLLAVPCLTALRAGAQTPTRKSAPQLLPYTITAVAGGGPVTPVPVYNSAMPPVQTGTNYTDTAFTIGQSCGTGSTLTATDTYGDGCLATQVGLALPRAVAADTQGNLFIVDGANALIRRIDARTGILSTYAGGGAALTCTAGTSTNGDGCAATAVKLTAPEGIALDPSNNVWFSDFNLGSIRRIDRVTGVITTPVNSAGTPGYRAGNVANPGVVVLAAAGQTFRPYGITFDRQGNLYIADENNSVVDVVNLQASTVTVATVSIPAGAIFSIAGTGCAYGNSTTGCGSSSYGTNPDGSASTAGKLDSPYQVAVDNAGNIYIADEFPYDVRVIIASTGIMNTFAGKFNAKAAAEPRGLATATSLASTQGVATDANGNVYIAVYDTTTTSSYLHRVDAATGILYPIAGQVVTAAPSLTQANFSNTAATYCSAKTDNIGDGCPGTRATLYSPYQPFVDPAGNVYFADQKNLLIRKISVGTQFPAIATGASVTQSVAIHYGAADTQGTYTLPTPGSGFGAVDFTLGAPACTINSDSTQDCVLPVTFTPTGAGIRTASLVVKSASGLISSFALTGTGNAALLLVDSTSNTGSTGTLGSGPFPAVAALAGDTAGNLYAAVPSTAGIQKIAQSSTTTLGTTTGATAVTVDPSGNVYAAYPAGYIVEIPASGAAQFPVGSGFTTPSGLAADIFGNLFVADSSANTVTRIAAGTLVQTVVASGLNGPTGLAVDYLGNLFIANTVANNIIEVPVSGAASITLGSGLSAPRAVATGAAGALYIADTRNARIVFIPNENGTLNTADQLTIASLGLSAPSGLVVTASGILYVADASANAIYLYNRNNATQAFGNDAIGIQLTAPADLISAGNLPVTFASPYFTATGNTGDFSLTPSALSSGTTLAPGFGVALTAGFKPTATGTHQAVYTFAASTGTGSTLVMPTLTLTGAGINPINSTTTTITATPTSGTYGQTVSITVTVAAAATVATPSGSVTVFVDNNASTPALTGGTVTFTVPGLSAGTHTITASYPGDTTSSPSTATPVTITLARAPLTVAPASFTKQYLAPLPTLTGILTGVVNNDAIGVTYATTATQASTPGAYPITATVTGSAATNYTATPSSGTLTITQAGTTTLLAASSTAVSPSTSVTFSATITPSTSGVPTGTVNFLSGTAVLAANVPVTAGKATYTTTFANSGTVNITAVYSGDPNYSASTSAPTAIVTSTPGFNLSTIPTTASIAQGQTALLSFNFNPTFSYAGTVTFSCTNLPATVGCIFSPTSVSPVAPATIDAAAFVALSITTVQPGGLVRAAPAPLGRTSSIAFAGIPALALLLGFAARRRKLNLRHLLSIALFAALAIGLGGCGTGHFATPTPTGTYNITVNATGTPVAGIAAVPTQTFTIAVTVHQ